MSVLNIILYIFALSFFVFSFIQKKYFYYPLFFSAILMGIIFKSREFGILENDDLYILWTNALIFHDTVIKREILADFFLYLVSINTNERGFVFFVSSLAFFVNFLSLRLIVRFISSNNKINAFLNISLSIIAFLGITYNLQIQLFRQSVAIGMFIIAIFAFKKNSFSQVILMVSSMLFHNYSVLLIVLYYYETQKKLLTTILVLTAVTFYVFVRGEGIIKNYYLYYVDIVPTLNILNYFINLSLGSFFKEFLLPIVVAVYFTITKSNNSRALLRVVIGVFFLAISYLFVVSEQAIFFRLTLIFSIIFSPIALYFFAALFPRYQSSILLITPFYIIKLFYNQSANILFLKCGTGFALGCN